MLEKHFQSEPLAQMLITRCHPGEPPSRLHQRLLLPTAFKVIWYLLEQLLHVFCCVNGSIGIKADEVGKLVEQVTVLSVVTCFTYSTENSLTDS